MTSGNGMSQDNTEEHNNLTTTQEMELLTTNDATVENGNIGASTHGNWTFRSLFHKFFGPPAIRVLQSISLLSFIAAFITISLLSGLIGNDYIDMTFGFKESDVQDMQSRIAYTLKFLILPVTFLFHFIFHLGFKRFRTVAWNPLDGNEDICLAESKILLNTLEQTVLTIGVQLVLVTYLQPEYIIKVIPAINIAFIIGRVLFWIGYPRYRHFGFCFSMIPAFMAIKFIWFEIIGLNQFIRNKIL